jgi:hypothetical protein
VAVGRVTSHQHDANNAPAVPELAVKTISALKTPGMAFDPAIPADLREKRHFSDLSFVSLTLA